MSIRTATMSNSYSSSVRRPGFLRKLVTFLLFVVGITCFMVILDINQTNLSPLLMTIFAILGIGLATGAGSRAVFYEWSGFIRFFLTLLVLPLGLFVLGFLTNWQMGIGPWKPWLEGVIDWVQLIQLGGALLVAMIALKAWWKPVSKIDDGMPEVRSSSWRSEPSPMTASMQAVQPRSPQVHSQENLTFLPRGKSRLKFAKANKARSRTIPAGDKLILAHSAQPTRSRRKRLFNRKPNLQISLYEDHRCPFCLEEVKRNDRRGVKKCEVCNALHHADCWAITGSCQVPHLNT